MNYKEELGISFPCLEVTTSITQSERLREILENYVVMQYRESNNGQEDEKKINQVHFLIEAPDPSATDDEIKNLARKANITINTRFLQEGDAL